MCHFIHRLTKLTGLGLSFVIGGGASAQSNNIKTKNLSDAFEVSIDTINGVTVTEITFAPGQLLAPTNGFITSIGNFDFGVMWSGQVNAQFLNGSGQTVVLDRSSSMSVRLLANDGTVISGRSIGSTPFQNIVEIAPGTTYNDAYVGGGGSGSGALSTSLVHYFNQPDSTPFTLRTSGVNVSLPSGLTVSSTSGTLIGEITISATFRYIDDFIWNHEGGGNLSDSASWRIGNATPSGAGTHVAFARAITDDAVISIDGNVTLGKLYFDNPDHSYTLAATAPGQSLTLSASSESNRGIEVRSGSHAITAPLIVTQGANGSGLNPASGVPIYLLPDTTLRISGGITGAGHILKGGEGLLEFDTTVSSATMHIGDGTVRFRGIGHAGTIYANYSEFTTGVESLAVVEFALERSVAFTASYLRSSLGFFGTATGGVLRVVSDSGRNHTLTLSPSANSTFQGGTDLLSGHIAVGHDSALGTGPLRVSPSAPDQTALSATGGLRTLANAIAIQAHDLTILGSDELHLNGVISGAGALVKRDTGRLRVGGDNTFAGGVDIHGGIVEAASATALGTGAVTVRPSSRLEINPSITVNNTLHVLSGATLQLSGTVGPLALEGGLLSGTGRVNGTLGGHGLVEPGNSEGILSIASLDPSDGLDFTFAFTAQQPDFDAPGASLNDVLLITDTTAPFAAPLGPDNTVKIYLSESVFLSGSAFGGFATSRDDATELLGAITNAEFEFYVESVGGSFAYEGRHYISVDRSLIQVSAGQLTTSDGDIAALQLIFGVIPEPAAAGALAASTVLLFALRRRRGRAAKRGTLPAYA